MADKIDEIFESMEKAYNAYVTGKFICDKCKQERPTYRSVMLIGSPLKSITGFTRVCETCYIKLIKDTISELKGEN